MQNHLNYKSLLCVLALSFALVISNANNAHATNFIKLEPTALQQGSSHKIYVSSEIDTKKAQKTIQSIGSKAIGFLGDPKLSMAQKEKAFKKLLQTHFNMNTISRFSLGRNWKTASAAERKEYQRLFERMVIRVYSSRFGDYQGEEFVVDRARVNGSKDALVTSHIVTNSGAKIQMDWRVRPDKKTGEYKVIDIIVEGVSMSLTQRSEFASIIQRGGGKIEVLLEHLRK